MNPISECDKLRLIFGFETRYISEHAAVQITTCPKDLRRVPFFQLVLCKSKLPAPFERSADKRAINASVDIDRNLVLGFR